MSSTFRIDVGLEYTASDTFNVIEGVTTYTVDLGDFIAPTSAYLKDFFASAGGIRNTIEDHLNDVSSGYTVTEVNGKYTISHASTFTLSFPNDSIREFLGFSADTYAAANTYTSDVQSPGVFIGSRPSVAMPGFRAYTKKTNVFRGKGRSINTAAFELFNVTLRIRADELDGWRIIARYMLQGHPFRLYQLEDDGSLAGYNPSPVSATLQSGSIDGCLDPNSGPLSDGWYNTALLDEMTVSFVMVKAAD